MNELIIVKQLPIIEEHLKTMAAEIDKQVETALSLVCTEETVKEVKKVRSDLNKQFAELEEQRKAVKNAVMQPYSDFEAIYKEYVSDKFKVADNGLKSKIEQVEKELKQKKEEEVKDFFKEYAEASCVSWLTWDMANINITMSTTVKKLKEQAQLFIKSVMDDLVVIENQEDSAEILIEYKKHRSLQQAIATVKQRKEQLTQMKATEEARKQAEAERKIHVAEVEKEIALSAPKVQEQKLKVQMYAATFKVKGTLEQLKQLKAFLEERGIKYEC